MVFSDPERMGQRGNIVGPLGKHYRDHKPFDLRDQTKDHWFNNTKSCYKSRATYTLRTAPDRYPWLRQMDNMTTNLAGTKWFNFTERLKLNVRGEAFNLFNHPLFKGPDTGYQNARFGMLPLEQQNFPRLIQVAAKLQF